MRKLWINVAALLLLAPLAPGAAAGTDCTYGNTDGVCVGDWEESSGDATCETEGQRSSSTGVRARYGNLAQIDASGNERCTRSSSGYHAHTHEIGVEANLLYRDADADRGQWGATASHWEHRSRQSWGSEFEHCGPSGAYWRPGIPSGYGYMFIFGADVCEHGDTESVQPAWGHLLP